MTPLLLACNNGRLGVATMLLERGADTEAKDRVSISISCNPLVLLCSVFNQHVVTQFSYN